MRSITRAAFKAGVLGGTVTGWWPDVELAGSFIAGEYIYLLFYILILFISKTTVILLTFTIFTYSIH